MAAATAQAWSYQLTIHYITESGTVTCKTVRGNVRGAEKAMRGFLRKKETEVIEGLVDAARIIASTGGVVAL